MIMNRFWTIGLTSALLGLALSGRSLGASAPILTEIVLLPVEYRVKPGDTIRSIAKHFGAD